MPWRPPFERPASPSDARLDRYRERAGVVLAEDGVVVAQLYLRVETHATRLGGLLWGRRWSLPYEVVHGFMEFTDGRFDDWLSWGRVLGR